VIGSVRRAGPFVAGLAYSFGNPLVSIQFEDGRTPPAAITVTLTKTAPADFAAAVTRTYAMIADGGANYSAAVRLRYRDSELNGNYEGTLQPWRVVGGSWTAQTRSAFDAINNWVEQSDATDFSTWTLASVAETPTPSASPTAPPTNTPTHTATFTPSETPTEIPTATPSSTLTATDTPSATQTPSATFTPEPRCGDGALDLGELCDDSNLVDGDGCQADCTLDRIPGNRHGGSATNARACLLEGSVVNPTNLVPTDNNGRPHFMQTCTNNDPRCDFDLDPTNRTCEFRVTGCLNNTDPRLPECTLKGVVDPVRVLLPNALRDPSNTARVVGALQNLRNPITGATGLTTPVAPTDANLCTEPFAVRVPLRGTTRVVFGQVRLVTVTKSVGATPRQTVDVDVVTLRCNP
jgi:cysteine-rich repeat protein